MPAGFWCSRVVLTVRHPCAARPSSGARNLGERILAHRSGLHELEATDLEVESSDAGDELAPGVRALAALSRSPDPLPSSA